MHMQRTYSRLQITPRRIVASALALAGALAGAACASSSGAAAGTYHPSTTAGSGSGSSWAGEPSGVHVNVSLGERKLYVKNGEEIVASYPIGVGRDAMPTPQGNYNVNRIVWNPPWNPPDEAWAANDEPAAPGASDNPMKVVKIYFKEPDYYIHGTGSLSSLGGAVSHGCLRMAPSDAASLAKYLMEHGGASRDASWFEHVESSNETQTVNLESSIPMHVAQ